MSRQLGSLVIACLATGSGCTHHQTLGDGRTLVGASVRVETLPAYVEDGDVMEKPGGVFIRTERGDFELREVRTITETRRARGALEGFGLGVLSGAVIGAALGYSGGDHPTPIAYTAGEHALVGGVVTGAVGGLVGLVVGAAIGSRDVYTVRF